MEEQLSVSLPDNLIALLLTELNRSFHVYRHAGINVFIFESNIIPVPGITGEETRSSNYFTHSD